MKVVVDANVIVSAAGWGGTPQIVVRWIASAPTVTWFASRSTLAECRAVLLRPRLGIAPSLAEDWLTFLVRATTLIPDPAVVTFVRDPNDAHVIACATAVGADYLITGDRDLLDAQLPPPTAAISAAAFKSRFIGRSPVGPSAA